jgi:hypothetical protein
MTFTKNLAIFKERIMMTFRKILLSVLCVGLVIGITWAKLIDAEVYEIPKTAVPPVIDGLPDDVWKTLDWNFQNSYDNGSVVPDGYFDLFGASKLLWDDENLYGIFYAQDDVLQDVHTNTWERDAVEFYTDADYSRGASYDGVDDQHINFRHEWFGNEAAVNRVSDMGFLASSPNLEGVEFVIRDDTTTQSGFWLEFKIPLETLSIPAAAGTLIGLEWQQNDNDGPNRESISKWWLQTGDNSWLEPRLFGTAMLSDRTVDTRLEIKKIPAGTAGPTIDAVWDPIYGKGNPITQNHVGNGTIFPEDFNDIFARTYLLYDEENLYGFFDVNDDILQDVHTNTWERDAVEMYTDADNSKGASYDGVDDQHLNFRHEWLGNEAAVNRVSDMGFLASSPNLEGVEFKIEDKTGDTSGFYIEFKIPLETIQLAPVRDTEIGFEVQQNDNDGPNRESISKWWLQNGDNSWLEPRLFGTAYLGSDIVTAVEENPAPVAERFSLAQNYPNPFNPTTNISYTLKSNGKVRLSVYDLMGREVAVLVDGVQSGGPHEITFSGAGLASGIYFYRLKTADAVLTKKMALIK